MIETFFVINKVIFNLFIKEYYLLTPGRFIDISKRINNKNTIPCKISPYPLGHPFEFAIGNPNFTVTQLTILNVYGFIIISTTIKV
jgi:hypothetical protein